MPNEYLDKVNLNGTTYDIKDTISGYTTNTGTVTSVGLSNASGESDFTIASTPVTTSGTITIKHSNTITAQSTQALYPIKFDKHGHITGAGTAVTVPTKVSDLTNDSGFITTETDPTVPSWAKANTKPSYTAGEVGAVATSAVGAASGVVPLNASSKIDSTYLPSYVDDVIEGYYYNNKFWKEGSHTTEISGEAGKIYVDLSTDKTYRYSGTAFVEISKGGSVVTVSRDLTSGTKVGIVSVDGSDYQLYAPTPASTTQSATTGISIVAHGTGTVTGVQSTTTTASKVTLGTEFSVPNVTSAGSASTWTFEEKTIPNVTSAGSASTWTFEEKTIPNVTSAGSASTWTFEEKTIPNVTAAGSGSFTQGSFSGGSFTQGTDSFTANTPTVINTSKFSGGSFTQGTDSFTKPTHAADNFTPASLQTGFYTAGSATTPASIDTSKFSGGSYSHSGFSGGSFTRGSFSGGSLSMTMDTTDTKKLNITFTAATHANDSFTAATYGTDNFTAASLQTGFYTAGTKGTPTTIDTSKFSGGSFTQGAFTQGSFTQGTDSFTAANLQSGFYTAGTSASFIQGEDEFTPATHGADSHTHTAPTIGTAIKVQSKSGGSNGSAPTLGTAIKVQSKSGGGNGSAPTLGTAIKVQSKSGGANGSAPTLGTAFTIPNVTSVDDVTVPIKNTSASTFVTGTTHTITDNGHTHSI